jgi:inorganic triphosphatase YgiF
MSVKEKIELEAKWSSRSESGFSAFRAEAVRLGSRVGRSRVVLIKDSYLDTEDGFFGKRRVSCRLRRADGRWDLTLKSRTALKNGVAFRRERTFLLGRGPGALARARALLSRVPGRETLAEAFVILNRRTVLPMTLPGGARAECSFDRVTLQRGRKAVRMLEVELEFLKGSKACFSAFVRAVKGREAFSPSKRSKVATALKAFGLEAAPSGSGGEVFSLVKGG